jgi:hypothetical protein
MCYKGDMQDKGYNARHARNKRHKRKVRIVRHFFIVDETIQLFLQNGNPSLPTARQERSEER